LTRFLNWGTVRPVRRLVIKTSKTIRKRIYDHIREQLLHGDIFPSQHLIEAKIAREIGTSRTPVREALHSLELEGLIESVPRVGYIVKPVSEEEVEEICAIRIVIEGLALRWAMRKAYGKLVEELRGNISLQEEKISRGDFIGFIELDAQFHEIIARHSGSKRLLELAQTLRQHMLRYRIRSMYTTDNALGAMNGHKGILEAIEKNDPEEVNKALVYHLERSREAIVRYTFKDMPALNE
jgi:DNA-binding GntR family transcriptional regulator